MTQEQFKSYIDSAWKIYDAKLIIEKAFSDVNRNPTLTMYPDLGEETLFIKMMGDALETIAVNPHVREDWEYAWYECGLSCRDLHYITEDNQDITKLDDLWSILIQGE